MQRGMASVLLVNFAHLVLCVRRGGECQGRRPLQYWRVGLGSGGGGEGWYNHCDCWKTSEVLCDCSDPQQRKTSSESLGAERERRLSAAQTLGWRTNLYVQYECFLHEAHCVGAAHSVISFQLLNGLCATSLVRSRRLPSVPVLSRLGDECAVVNPALDGLWLAVDNQWLEFSWLACYHLITSPWSSVGQSESRDIEPQMGENRWMY